MLKICFIALFFIGVSSEDEEIVVPEAAKRTIARVSKPPKASLVNRHISRFGSTAARELKSEFSMEKD